MSTLTAVAGHIGNIKIETSPTTSLKRKQNENKENVSEQTNVASPTKVVRSKNPQLQVLQENTELQALVQKTQALALKNPYLLPFKNDSNQVYAIEDDRLPLKTIAYFKTPQSHQKEHWIFVETLMWKMAGVFGWEEIFTPTTPCTLQLGNTPVAGTLQPAIDGVIVWSLINENLQDLMPFASILKTLVIATIIGGGDLHAKNIIFDIRRGLLRLFDNIRSLAHSIFLIKRSDGVSLNSPLRNCLSSLQKSNLQLLPEHKQAIASLVKSAKEKLSAFRELLVSPEIAASIKKLPPNWFHSDLVLNAMDQRMGALQRALEEDKINTLADIPLYASPGYRLALAMIYTSRQLNKGKVEQASKLLLSSHTAVVGAAPINADFKICNKHFFSIIQVLTLSEDHSLPFFETIKKIQELINAHFSNPSELHVNDKQKIIADNHTALVKLSLRAMPDWKDANTVDQEHFRIPDKPTPPKSELEKTQHEFDSTLERIKNLFTIRSMLESKTTELKKEKMEIEVQINKLKNRIKRTTKNKQLLQSHQEALEIYQNRSKYLLEPIVKNAAFIHTVNLRIQELDNLRISLYEKFAESQTPVKSTSDKKEK